MMLNIITNIIACISLLAMSSLAQDLPNEKGPSTKQKALIERGYGMFIHFGVNTFNETEWSDGTLPVSSYNPTKLDCEQWVETAKQAGFRYIILITKHHEGFCLWDSKYTDYDVASSPVKTDVVAEVAKACKKHGIELGLYYSLWDRYEPTHKKKNSAEYVQFMKNQLTELLTNYGLICELWFDGGWAKPDKAWDMPGLYEHINKLQPNCAIASNHTIGMHEFSDSVQAGPFTHLHHYRTKKFNIQAFINDEWLTIHTGSTIEAAKVINFPEVIKAKKIRFNILDATKPARLKHISVSLKNSQGIRSIK